MKPVIMLTLGLALLTMTACETWVGEYGHLKPVGCAGLGIGLVAAKEKLGTDPTATEQATYDALVVGVLVECPSLIPPA